MDEGQTNSSRPLSEVYAAALYEVDWLVTGIDDIPQTVPLQLNKPSELLEAIFNITGQATSALITAYNPLGQRISQKDNEARQAELVAAVDARALRYLTGRGRDPEGLWPAEESLLIIGLSREAACELGDRFQQNAILFADEDFVPRLIFLT